MADSDVMTREALFQKICEQWQRTEDAIGAVGEHFDKPCYDGWTVGDVFRHITFSNHNHSSQIRALLATGEFPFSMDQNDEGNARFAALDYKMLRIELNTAHGVVWMYIQRFSNEDLAQTFSVTGNEATLGQILGMLAQHEAGHVAEALAAAGLSDADVVPLETAHRWA